MAGSAEKGRRALKRHAEPEPAEPSPELLRALDITAQELAEREQAHRIAQARSDAACRAEQERRVH
jgi:hypothetical protein